MKNQTKIFIETKEGVLSLKQISQITGIRYEIIRGRYYKGWRGDRLLESYKHPSVLKLEYKGREMTLREISQLEGIPLTALRERYRRGERGDGIGRKVKKRDYQKIIGLKFGKLSIRGIRKQEGHIYAECKCECGRLCVRELSYIIGGKRQFSCGCTRGQSSIVHGKSKTREHRIWRGMLQRCYNPNTKAYCYYGERGIDVCERWRESFSNFYEDMGPAPTPKHSIDRINNDKGYSPDNCRWATPQEQSSNRRCVIRISHNGKQYTQKELSALFGVSVYKIEKWRKTGLIGEKLDALI